MSKKKILVLGATGQDGSTICKYLVKKKFKVFGISRKGIYFKNKVFHLEKIIYCKNVLKSLESGFLGLC